MLSTVNTRQFLSREQPILYIHSCCLLILFHNTHLLDTYPTKVFDKITNKWYNVNSSYKEKHIQLYKIMVILSDICSSSHCHTWSWIIRFLYYSFITEHYSFHNWYLLRITYCSSIPIITHSYLPSHIFYSIDSWYSLSASHSS